MSNPLFVPPGLVGPTGMPAKSDAELATEEAEQAAHDADMSFLLTTPVVLQSLVLMFNPSTFALANFWTSQLSGFLAAVVASGRWEETLEYLKEDPRSARFLPVWEALRKALDDETPADA